MRDIIKFLLEIGYWAGGWTGFVLMWVGAVVIIPIVKVLNDKPPED